MKQATKKDQRGLTRVGLILIIVLGGILVLAIAWQWSRDKASKDNQPTTAATEKAIQDARCDYADTDLCKFFAVQKVTKQYTLTFKEETGNQKSEATLKRDGDSKFQLKITGTGAKEIVSINDALYTKQADGTWAKHITPRTEANKHIDGIVPPLPEATKNAGPTRISYRKTGTEQCGSASCLKYQVHNPTAPTTTTFLWFDATDYSLQRIQATSPTGKRTLTYNYAALTIAAPSPAKDVATSPTPSTAVQGQSTTLPKTGDN